MSEMERIVRMMRKSAAHSMMLQLTVAEQETLLDYIRLANDDLAKEVEPGMAHASTHMEWWRDGESQRMEQEAEGLQSQAEYVREQWGVLDNLREAVKADKNIHLDHNDAEALSSLIDTLLDECGNFPTAQKMEDVEVKTTGQLIDELIIENLKIWHLVDEAHSGEKHVQDEIQRHNDIRRGLVRALDRRLGERDIGGRV